MGQGGLSPIPPIITLLRRGLCHFLIEPLQQIAGKSPANSMSNFRTVVGFLELLISSTNET